MTEPTRIDVYARLLEFCPPYSPSSPWDNLELDPGAYACPEDPQEVLEALTEEFSGELLLESGVAVPDSSAADEGTLDEGDDSDADEVSETDEASDDEQADDEQADEEAEEEEQNGEEEDDEDEDEEDEDADDEMDERPEPELRLAPALSDPRQGLVALSRDRGDPARRPLDVLVPGGCLSGRSPVVAVVQDRWTRKVAGVGHDRNRLCAAFTIEEVIVLRALRIPATLACGLDQFAAQEIPPVGRKFEWQARSDPMRLPEGTVQKAVHPKMMRGSFAVNDVPSSDERARGEEQQFPLVLVGCTLSALRAEPPAGLQPALRHLQEIARFLEIDLGHTFLWQPSSVELRRVGFCAQFGLPEDVRRAVLDSMDSSCRDVAGRKDGRFHARTLAEAIASWHAENRDGDDRRHREWCWSRLEQCLDQEVLAPLRHEAADATDPALRSVLSALAEMSRLVHLKLLSSSVRLSQTLASGDPARAASLPEGEWKQLTVAIDRLTALAKQLDGLRREGPRPRPANSGASQGRSASPANGGRPRKGDR